MNKSQKRSKDGKMKYNCNEKKRVTNMVDIIVTISISALC